MLTCVEIVPFNITHNAEPEACDLLLEVERLSDILGYADEANYQRICLYLLSNADYAADPEDAEILRVVLSIYQKLDKRPESLFIAMKLDDPELAQQIFDETQDEFVSLLFFCLCLILTCLIGP